MLISFMISKCLHRFCNIVSSLSAVFERFASHKRFQRGHFILLEYLVLCPPINCIMLQKIILTKNKKKMTTKGHLGKVSLFVDLAGHITLVLSGYRVGITVACYKKKKTRMKCSNSSFSLRMSTVS